MKVVIILLFIYSNLQALTIGDLFDALKKNPNTTLDNLSIKGVAIGEDLVTSKLYPKLEAIASVEHYNSPTNLLPVTPKTSATFSNPNIPQPFGKDILRAGIQLSMPLFIKSIYTTREELKYLKFSAQQKKKLNFIQKEALIVGANASWQYLTELKKSLLLKKQSIKKSEKMIRIGVKSGRYPQSQLYKMQEALNQIDIAINQIDTNMESYKNTIYELTEIRLKQPVEIKQVASIDTKEFLALKPLLLKQQADRLKIKATKEKLLPSFMVKGKYFYNQTDAYNNNKEVNKDYSSIGIYMQMPIYDKTSLAEVQKAKVAYQKTKMQTKKTLLSLKSKANNLKVALPLLEKSIELSKKSVENQKKLLKIAKVAYKSSRMTEEEYLRYEDSLENVRANLYLLISKKMQTLSNLAVLYGNNLKRILK